MATYLKEIETASTHEEVSAVLRQNGLEAAAERLNQLGSLMAEDDNEPRFEIESVKALASFLMTEKQLPEPQIGVTPDGLLQIEWRVATSGILAMEFLVSRLIRFAAISAPVRPGIDRLSVHGTLPKDATLKAVSPFTRHL